MIDVDDLNELQVVTKREYRRGYLAQVNGDQARLRYRKLLRTPDGRIIVCRPAVGEERPKTPLWGVPHALVLFLLTAWPITVVGLVLGVLLLARTLS